MADLGFEEGSVCGRNGCHGVIECGERSGDCSCHIAPPCGACTEPTEFCPVCDWHLVDDETQFNGFLVGPVKPSGAWTHYRERPLDPTKIDWRSKSDTHFTMIKEGVCPPGTTKEEVLAVIGAGTFGGRFERFSDGQFKYIAYTD